ncbi:tyrosine-type recombinase/integrase [Actinomadura livida]|uniref:Integrase n=1 Tax=Actinomadura livida TaxID=79909 RepID=A0A7W7MXC4_9ACTN|nr:MULTISPECIES: site-specific integrase [Actinomadura]MBB4774681.1 integrase [Actinomadura catellatispora]GGU06670.1 DMT family permease [Actinomadura livida]
MAYAEKRGNKWRVRYVRPDGSTASQSGFDTKQAALHWGEEQEAGIRRHRWNDPRDGAALLADWVELWWAGQDLEATTEAKYRYLIDHHIVPAFGNRPVSTFTSPEEVVAWEKRTRTNGFSHRTAADARSLLGTILGDAKERGMVASNVAVKRRGRGRKRTRRTIAVRGPEKVWATSLQALLLAERCALLSGRDDDFVLIVLAAYTGMRWGEVHGLERPACRLDRIQIDWQLRELAGRLEMVPPKDDSHRPVDLPPFLAALVSDQSTRTRGRCACQGRTPECGGRGQFLFLSPDGGHHRRSNYARRIFQPAGDGRYPGGTRQAGKRILVEATGWPGVPIPPWPDAVAGQPFVPPRGKGIRVVDEDASPAVWLPLVEGLTPHGLRHSHKTWMLEDGIPEVLQAERLGHTVPGIRGVYSHISDGMRDELKAKLQRRWEQSLAQRLRFGAASPVPLLNRLLEAAQAKGTARGHLASA